MIFRETPLAGAFVIQPEEARDERGFFARMYCREEFERLGLVAEIAQCGLSMTAHRGTIRGMHFQRAPHEETKTVRCTRGAVYDVIVDLRPGSGTLLRWFAVELTGANRLALYVPAGFAHGFQTLADDCEVYYQISTPHAPGAADGIRWNDPAVGIRWPLPVSVISERDNAYPDVRL